MPDSLPDSLDFLKQVERNKRFVGTVPVSKLERLVGSLHSDAGELQADISFAIRAGVPCLDGKVSAEVELECQRCLEPITLLISGSFRFGLITSEEDIDMLPAEFEPYLVTEGEQSLFDVIEDELILSLPLVTRHEENCSDAVREQGAEDNKQDTYRPFAGLKDLMTQD